MSMPAAINIKPIRISEAKAINLSCSECVNLIKNREANNIIAHEARIDAAITKMLLLKPIAVITLSIEKTASIKIICAIALAARHGERNAKSSRQGRRGFIPSARRAVGAKASLCLKLYFHAVEAYRSKMAKKNTQFSSKPA